MQDQAQQSLPRQGRDVMGAWGVLRGELRYPPNHVTPSESHRNVLTHLSAFAKAVLSAEPALPYLRPSAAANVSGILQDSVPVSPPLERFPQCSRVEGISSSDASYTLLLPQWPP